jgi:diacylglycerol kinase family enzyme
MCRAQSVTVGNSGALPGGFAIMPDARLDDGRLDVVILAPAGPLGWADVGYRVVVGSRRDDARLARHRASQVEISTDGTALPRHVDGEIIAPSRELSVRVLPDALLVRIPAG